MPRWMAVGGLMALCACGGGPAAPSPAFTGNYTLVVETSAVCRLQVSRYQWELQGTSTGTGAGAAYRLTLPGGDNTVDVTLAYATARRGVSSSSLTGNITTRVAPFGAQLRVATTGGARGTGSAGPGDRGQVLDGVLNGTIALSNVGDTASNTLGSCTAADHRWTLTPR